jgi:hypothetical protein
MLAFDLYCGKSGRQGPARQDVLRADRVGPGIEIDEVAGPHIDGADAETGADTGSLKATLEELIDFNRLNAVNAS